VDITDEGFFGQTQRYNKTYNSCEAFIEDMRNGELMEGFFLSEAAFQGIVGMIAGNKQMAEEVNNHAVLIALMADKGLELGGILELAESFING
jgi:hypothetical protein